MDERKVTVVFCVTNCDMVCESDYFTIHFPTHDTKLIEKYFETTDLRILNMHKTVYYPACEKESYLKLMDERRVDLLELI